MKTIFIVLALILFVACEKEIIYVPVEIQYSNISEKALQAIEGNLCSLNGFPVSVSILVVHHTPVEYEEFFYTTDEYSRILVVDSSKTQICNKVGL